MRDTARHRFASGLALGAALAAASIPLAGCPGVPPVPEALAAPARSGMPSPTAEPGTGVRIDVQREYYEIAGRSEGDLLVAMQRLGPAWGERRFFGLTNTALEYGYRHTVGSGWCAIRDASVLAEVRVTLPLWRHPQGTPYALERDWRNFERALAGHEEGHVRLAQQEANLLFVRLERLSARDCSALDRDAGLLASEIRSTFAARHADYDLRTDHGRSQGAAWPRE
jgi:predicted secreted Zn-dependent protease